MQDLFFILTVYDNFLVGSPSVRCNVMETHSDRSLSVRMFLQTRGGGWICLNDKLVANNFAKISTGECGKEREENVEHKFCLKQKKSLF